jgi:hypothetical protein
MNMKAKLVYSKGSLERVSKFLELLLYEMETGWVEKVTGALVIQSDRFLGEGFGEPEVRRLIRRFGIQYISDTYPLHNNCWLGYKSYNQYFDGAYILQTKNRLDRLRAIERIKTEKQKIDAILYRQIPVTKTSFDPLSRVLSYGAKTYRPTDRTRSTLLTKLWEERKRVCLDDNKTLRVGKLFPKEAIALQINLIESIREFNKIKNKKLMEHISELNRIFKTKKFPLHIHIRGGVQLIEECSKE